MKSLNSQSLMSCRSLEDKKAEKTKEASLVKLHREV